MPGFIDPLCVHAGMQKKHLGHARNEIKPYHLEKIYTYLNIPGNLTEFICVTK